MHTSYITIEIQLNSTEHASSDCESESESENSEDDMQFDQFAHLPFDMSKTTKGKPMMLFDGYEYICLIAVSMVYRGRVAIKKHGMALFQTTLEVTQQSVNFCRFCMPSRI
jgi:hypothetical protein